MESYLQFTQGEWGECENCGTQLDTDKDGYYEAWECPDCMTTLCDGCKDCHECLPDTESED